MTHEHRRFLELDEGRSLAAVPAARSPRLFISHSSADAELARAVLELLRNGLHLRSEEIVCTSVEGYRLPGGTDTDEHLRGAVVNAEAFVGIVSPSSLKSLYVVFELGARWGAYKSLVPLLAPGTNPNVLGGPLARLNALRCDNRADLFQLVRELASMLGVEAERTDALQSYVDCIVAMPPALPERQHVPTVEAGERGGVSELGLRLVVALRDQDGETEASLALLLNCRVQRVVYELEQLQRLNLVTGWGSYEDGAMHYGLSHEGRRHLHEHGLLD